MNKIKVVVMDIDGTLVNSEKKLTKETKQALLKCQEKGVRLILASGRPTTGMIWLAKELELDKNNGLIVSYNGSRVIDCTTNKLLFDAPLSVEDTKRVLNHMKKFDVNPMIDHENYMYVHDVYAYKVFEESRGGNFLLKEVEDLESFVSFPTNKILTSGDPEYLKANYKEMMEPFEDEINCMFTAPFYFEYTAKGIDKAAALDKILKPLGYERKDLIGFGDGHNDETMVEYCGTSVAMANAVETLKEMADYITLSNDEDGIAKALYKYLPEVFE